MSWLGGKKIALEVSRTLGVLGVGGVGGVGGGARIIVGFDSKLAARLAAMGANVTFVSDVERDVDRATTAAVSLSQLSSLGRELGAAVIVGAASRDDRDAIVSSFCEILAGKSPMALIDRVQRQVASRTALLGGLSDLEQTAIGRVVITVGRRSDRRVQASLES